MKNILFVCTKNKWRSATAEQLYKNHTSLAVRSRGISRSARQVLKDADVLWADIIFVMENKHKTFITQQFRHSLQGQSINVLDIPDIYPYMDKALVDWLTDSIDSYLNSQLPS